MKILNKYVQALSLQLIKKEILAQVFSCAFVEIFKNTLFHKMPLVLLLKVNKKSRTNVNWHIQDIAVSIVNLEPLFGPRQILQSWIMHSEKWDNLTLWGKLKFF